MFGKVRPAPLGAADGWTARSGATGRISLISSSTPPPRPRVPQPTLSPRTRRGRGTAVFPLFHSRRLIQCIIYEANFSNLYAGYGSRCEDWADGSSRRGRSRWWLVGAQEGSRRRREMFEEQVASRSSGDARKLSAVCGDAFTTCPVRLGRRG